MMKLKTALPVALLVLAMVFITACAPRGDGGDSTINFANVRSAFAEAGYIVVGPLNMAHMRYISASNAAEGEEFWLWQYNSELMATVGWDSAGGYIADRPNMTRDRSGLFVWYGTASAIAIFEATRRQVRGDVVYGR